MARKTNTSINGKEYYRITKTIGHKLNAAGEEVPVRKSFYGKSKKEAEDKYDTFIEQRKKGLVTNSKSFGIELENWINAFFILDESLARTTKQSYLAAWRRYIKDSDLSYQNLNDVTAETIQTFYNNLDCKPAAVKKLNNLLRRFYRHLATTGKAFDFTASLVVPNDKSRQAEKEKEIVTWTSEEIRLIFSNFDKADPRFRFRFLLVMAYYTGCRISELRGLRYDDIDLKNKTVTIRRQVTDKKELTTGALNTTRTFDVAPLKTDSSLRTIPLKDIVIKELTQHRAWQNREMMKKGYRTEYIFTTDTGEFYDRRNIQNGLARYYKRIGIEPYKTGKSDAPVYKSPHCFRHTFATNLAAAGVPLDEAAALLGHSDISMTAKYYINVDADRKRSAINKLPDVM